MCLCFVRGWQAWPSLIASTFSAVFIVSAGDCSPHGRHRDCGCHGLRLGNPRGYFYLASEIGEMESVSGYMI